MSNNIVGLTPILGNVSRDVTGEGYLASVLAVLRHHEVLEEYEHSDVELSPPNSGEVRLGPLTALEKECFVVGMLLHQLVRDELIEVEASANDNITALAREKKVPIAVAAQEYTQSAEFPEEMKSFLNLCTVANLNLMSIYEFGVRARYDAWGGPIIVRRGFEAYGYGL